MSSGPLQRGKRRVIFVVVDPATVPQRTNMEVGSSFFEVAEPLDHDTFLSVCDDVLRDSLLLLAPFGLPRSAVMFALPFLPAVNDSARLSPLLPRSLAVPSLAWLH